MIKKIAYLILLIILISIIGYYLYKDSPISPESNSTQVATSFYPYFFFASEIGGEKVDVMNVTPPGVEPHDYELTPRDIVNIENSDFLIINGVIEPWAEKIKGDLTGKNTTILKMDKSMFSLKADSEDDEHEGDMDHNIDPHIWLSPRLAKLQVDEILKLYLKTDSVNSDYYTNNAMDLITKLNGLDNEYKSSLSNCKSKVIVTSHSAFNYLAYDYGLTQTAISGLSSNSEPSLKQLSEIANYARLNNVKYIFFESLVSPKLSNTLANEVGAKTLVLNPIEGLTEDELSQGKNYLDIMQENLENLKIALECQ